MSTRIQCVHRWPCWRVLCPGGRHTGRYWVAVTEAEGLLRVRCDECATAGEPDHTATATPAGSPVHRKRPGVPALPSGRVRPGLRRRPGHRQTAGPHSRGVCGLLVVGDGGGVAAHRNPYRGNAGADPPQLRRLHAAHHRRGCADGAGRPVQDRRGAPVAGFTGTRRGLDCHSSSRSATARPLCRWRLPTVCSSRSGARRCRCCSNGA